MAEQDKQAKADGRADNYFFNDSLLFRLVTKMQASLVPELAELGAWAGHRETEAKARAARIFPPRLSARAGAEPELDIHPAYHGLLTRARHAGLAGSLGEEAEEGVFACRARACRLVLMAQAEPAAAQEMAQTKAAYGLLARENAALAAALRPWLTGRIHDPSRRFYQAKQSMNLGFAAEEDSRAPCMAEKLSFSERGGGFTAAAGGAPLYALQGVKRAVLAPLSDGFIVSAAAEGEMRLFFVPAFIAEGQSNKIALRPVVPGFAAANTALAAPCCALEFHGSIGFLLGSAALTNAQALDAARDALLTDYAALAAGSARAALKTCLFVLRGGESEARALRRRIAADAALDAAAAEILALRLAEARDKAAANESQAALAAVLAPVLGFWLCRFLPQLKTTMAELSGQGFMGQTDNAAFSAPLFPAFYGGEGLNSQADVNLLSMLVRLKRVLSAQNAAFATAAAAECAALPKPVAEGAKQILTLAARRTEADGNAAFLFADRLVYSFAAAGFYALECGPIAAAYAESRLGGTRQTGYGDFGLRYHADFVLEALYPNL